MKTSRMSLVLVVVVCLCAASGARAELTLDKSLTPFSYTDYRPMPDPDGVPLYPPRLEIPGFGGVGAGTGRGVAYFLKGLDKSLVSRSEQRDKLMDDLIVYSETVNEDGAVLIKKAKAVTLKQLDDFNFKVGGGLVYDRLKKYRLVHTHEQKARATVLAAWSDVNAAVAEVDRVKSKEYARDLSKEQASLSKEKADIMARAKKAAWVKEALSTVKGAISTVSAVIDDPNKIKGLLVDGAAGLIDDILVQRVLDDNWETLNRIDVRLAAIETALPKENDRQLHDELVKAQEHLISARHKLFAAQLDEKLASVEAWDLLDQLASNERGYKRIDLFQGLHLYNADMRHLGDRIQQHGNEYLNLLDSGAPGYGPRLHIDIARDIDQVAMANSKAESAQYGAWIKRAMATQAYVKENIGWYQSERDDVLRQIGAVGVGANLALVDAIIQHVLTVLQSTTDF